MGLEKALYALVCFDKRRCLFLKDGTIAPPLARTPILVTGLVEYLDQLLQLAIVLG
jgi:hypothetical protein